MRGADLAASRSRESDIGRPRACCNFLGAGAERRVVTARERTEARDRRTPRPWTFFWCRGRSPGSQVGAESGLPDAKNAPVTSVGFNSLLTVAGAAPDLLHWSATHRLPIFATKSCDRMEP